jgi:hypothetical protein
LRGPTQTCENKLAAEDSDYVFASTKMRGKQPYWMSRIMQHHIKPVAAKTGIEINNNNPKVVQGLLIDMPRTQSR